MDGTLTHTNELIYAAFNHVAKKYQGKEYTPKEISAMFGPPEDGAIENLVGKDRLDAAMTDLVEFYRTNHDAMAGTYDGVIEILQFLKERGALIALFTGKGIKTAVITMEKLGMKNFFDMVVTGSDVVNHKPSAEGIQKIINRFGLDPKNVLMVGDAVADVKAAREAGVSIAAVVWDSYGKDSVLAMEVDYLFHSVKEFDRWIRAEFPTSVASLAQ